MNRKSPNAADDQTQKMAQEAIDEARMVLPGIQALFGFQLIAMFNEQFRQFSGFEQILHFAALLLIAFAIGLIMTPAAYHRQVHPGTVDRFFVRLASFLVTLAMAPLMAGLSLDVYLLGRIVLSSHLVAIAIAALLFVVLAALWFVFPQVMKFRRKGSGGTGAS
jgi:hypothetical protein